MISLLSNSCLAPSKRSGNGAGGGAVAKEPEAPTEPLPEPAVSGSPGGDGINDVPPIGQQPSVPTECYKADASTCEFEVAIVRHTNELRASQQLPPVRISNRLSFVARKWSETQGRRRRIGHEGFGTRSRDVSNEFGNANGIRVFSENVLVRGISRNFSPDAEAKKVVQQWARSPGHRRNMLTNNRSQFLSLGAGIFMIGNQLYATQIFGTDNQGTEAK